VQATQVSRSKDILNRVQEIVSGARKELYINHFYVNKNSLMSPMCFCYALFMSC